MMSRGLILLSLIFSVLPLAGAPAHKVETIGACASADFAEAIRDSLQQQGFRVTTDSGTLCELWLRKTIPQKEGSSGADYGTIGNGTFVGVIIYSGKGGDYRGQAVKAGAYTLRYQAIPQDGNHLGVSPTPDFLLLAPAAADKNPDQVIESQELIKLSKQASGTNHPIPLHLTNPAAAGATAFRETDEGHWALEVKTKAQAGGGAEVDFPLAIILIGKAEG